MITKKDHQILAQFASSVRRRFPGARIWAFGSRARGIAPGDSDFDVCVVLNRIDDAVDQTTMEIAWEVGFEHDMVISTVTYSRQEFEEGPCSESPLVQSILKEGVAA